RGFTLVGANRHHVLGDPAFADLTHSLEVVARDNDGFPVPPNQPLEDDALGEATVVKTIRKRADDLDTDQVDLGVAHETGDRLDDPGGGTVAVEGQACAWCDAVEFSAEESDARDRPGDPARVAAGREFYGDG